MAGTGQLDEFLLVLAQHRLLDEHQIIGLQPVHQDFGHGLVDPAVKIHRNAQSVAHGLADRRHALHRRIEFVVVIDPPQLVRRVHLDGPIALRYGLARRFGRVARMVPAYPAVDLDSVPNPAAQHVIHRHVVELALDIPHRLLDSGNRARQYGSAPIKARAVEHLERILDLTGAFTDQMPGHFVDAGRHRRAPAFYDRFPPAHNARFGCHLQKQPARRNLK